MKSKWKQLAQQKTVDAEPGVPPKIETSKWKQKAKEIKQKKLSGFTGSWNEDLTWGETLLSAAKNAPKSAVRYGKGIYETIAHPIQTAKSMVGLAESGAQALAMQEPSDPYSIGKSFKLSAQGMQKLQPLVDELKNRYGSVDNFKQSLAQDPAFVLGDVAALLIPAGKLTGLKAIEKFGGTLEPVNMVKNSLALPFKLVPEKVPISQYQSAVKFGTTLKRTKLDRVTKIALDEKIMPTARGLKRLRNKINNYNTRITNLINEATNKGVKLNIRDIYKGLDGIKKEFAAMSDEPLKWDAAFNVMKKNLKRHLKSGEYRTPQQIQSLKQYIYKELKTFYEKNKASPAKVELRQAVARNARKMLEEIIPEIKQLNKDEGALLELWDTLEQKANRITNRDLIGIGLPVKMGVGSGVGYMFAGETGAKVGTALGFALGIYDTPQVKAKLNIVLNTLTNRGIEYKMTPTLARIVGAEAGKEQKE